MWKRGLRGWKKRAAPPASPESLRRAGQAGYPPPVCSITGDAIDRVAQAIDQLASDVQAGSGSARHAEPQHAARVADIWRMITALDPQLARLVSRYTAPAEPADDAGPS